ncbi:MAG: GNAT family N-acetyltransferase [Subdoligranulum sp.]|nr:GNAT family N-acetyltransferase [Subdoligranulum sp.]MBD5102922.1 GNAT family N-acetyltransferase [Subdoligranulum sp.]
MEITYKDMHNFREKDLQDLFLSVEWSSGRYPEKLVIAMQNYETVFTAWDGDTLAGLICAMDDGIMTAYVHYLLVDPAYQHRGIGGKLVEMVKEKYRDYLRVLLVAYDDGVGFYDRLGFVKAEGKNTMQIVRL